MGAPRLFQNRFEVLRTLGQGGMGVVYEALDRQRGSVVALKTLKNFDAESLYRFKREFRSISQFAHPNLVSLHELFATDDEWFFTMEFVPGVPFVRWVRAAAEGDEEPATVVGVDESGTRGVRAEAPSAFVPGHAPTVYDRLWAALPQLAQGLAALHANGWVHRDVKPSNVLVSSEGRVVVLDFGVITAQRIGSEDDIVGTPNYMAPEQVRREPPVPASDWYSFGVLMFECLTGRRPIGGGAITVLAAKSEGATPHLPLELVPPDAPPELVSLCADLLRFDPAERPTGAEILRRLARQDTALPRPLGACPAERARRRFVGREAPLGELLRAMSAVEEGDGRAVLVSGPSGIGKSALLDELLTPLRSRADVLVLEGRCSEQETVPYRALDRVVDALCEWLRDQPRADLKRLLPGGAGPLARAFPVMHRLGGPRVEAGGSLEVARARALDELRALLRRIVAERRVVLFIDDLQWGDLESAALLRELVVPSGPPLLFLGAFRSESGEANPMLDALVSAAREAPGALVELTLDGLTVDELRLIADDHLRGLGAPDDVAVEIAEAADGSPFFAHELASLAAVSFRGGEAIERMAPREFAVPFIRRSE